MKKIVFLLVLIVFLVSSCTSKEKEQIVSIVVDDVVQENISVPEKEILVPEPVEETLEVKEKEPIVEDNLPVLEEVQIPEWDIAEEKIEEITDIIPEEIIINEPVVALSWIYKDYDASLVGKTENTILFFHANWCPSCRAADTKISQGIDEIPENLTILKTDFDTQIDLRKKYGVVSQHTFVQVDTEGNLIKKWVGGTTVDDLVEKLN